MLIGGRFPFHGFGRSIEKLEHNVAVVLSDFDSSTEIIKTAEDVGQLSLSEQ